MPGISHSLKKSLCLLPSLYTVPEPQMVRFRDYSAHNEDQPPCFLLLGYPITSALEELDIPCLSDN